MNNDIFSFFITLIAGFSTILGYFIIYFKNNERNIISLSLYLSSGVMIAVSLFDLLPNSYKYFSNYYFNIFSILLIFVYFILGILISYYINNKINNKNNIFKLGIITMITLFLHNIPEGIITYLTSNYDLKIGLNLSFAIMLHNIPEGISISIPVYYATKCRKTAFLYTFISSVAEPFGALLAFLFLKDVSLIILGILLSIVAGIMINISISLLIPNAIKIKTNNFYYLLIGFFLVLLTAFFI